MYRYGERDGQYICIYIERDGEYRYIYGETDWLE